MSENDSLAFRWLEKKKDFPDPKLWQFPDLTKSLLTFFWSWEPSLSYRGFFELSRFDLPKCLSYRRFDRVWYNKRFEFPRTDLFMSCLDSIVMYFLLYCTGAPAVFLPLARLACFTCSFEECFILDALDELVRMTGLDCICWLQVCDTVE